MVRALQVKLYVMGQLLQDDMQPLFNVRGIYDGATVSFMPGQHSAESKEPSLCATQCKQKLRMGQKLNPSRSWQSVFAC